MADSAVITGGCHCGNLRFTLQWPGDQDIIATRRCGCSFCQKHGATWTSNRRAVLQLQVNDADQAERYRFGTETADFHCCKRCGVVTIASCTIDAQEYAVVNVNCFEDSSGLSFTESPTDFDGEDIGDRLSRRQQNWIPDVRIRQVSTDD